MMIKEADIVRPERLAGLYQTPVFISANSKDHLIEADLGFAVNPLYKQDKLCFFPGKVYYQRLLLVDGKNNSIKDDARTIVIAGKLDESTGIRFNLDIYPSLPGNAVDTSSLILPFYPEINTEIVLRDKELINTFYHFSCLKIVYKTGGNSRLQLRHIGNYNSSSLSAILSKWHPDPIKLTPNFL